MVAITNNYNFTGCISNYFFYYKGVLLVSSTSFLFLKKDREEKNYDGLEFSSF